MLKIAFDKIYKHPLDENHRFPMIKYDLIPEQLLRENTCNHENFFKPSSLKDNNVLVLNFDKYGVLTNKNLLNKGDLNNIDFRAKGFPEELVDNEPEEKGYEI